MPASSASTDAPEDAAAGPPTLFSGESPGASSAKTGEGQPGSNAKNGGARGENAGGAEGFLGRVSKVEAPQRPPLLSERDQRAVKDARHEAERRIKEVETIRRNLAEMEEAGNEVAADFLSDHERDLSDRREYAIKQCYRAITGALNGRYNTRLETRRVFHRAYPDSVRSRWTEGQRMELLEVRAIEEAIDEAVDTEDLTEAGRRATVERFRSEMASWKDPRVRKSLVSLPGYVRFDDFTDKTKLDYNCRDAVPALADSLWLFEKGAADAPRSFLSELRGTHTIIPTNEKLGPVEITSASMNPFEKVEAVKFHKNGALKIYFSKPEHTRAFAELFELS